MIVQADPQALAAHGATLTDIVAAISANNNRAPGGYATSGSKETSIDIRGDIQDPATVANLLLSSSSAAKMTPILTTDVPASAPS